MSTLSNEKDMILDNMIKSYLKIHDEYIQNDSILKEEDEIQSKLQTHQYQFIAQGFAVMESSIKWGEFLINHPELGEFKNEIISRIKELENCEKGKTYDLMGHLAYLEKKINNYYGRKLLEKEFYSKIAPLEKINTETVQFNWNFTEPYYTAQYFFYEGDPS